ncbi:MAG: tetratricopeptide repeat protein [Gemmataceae bacterium]|nr:tetratricopeptide repeat protein [Gemmata sp.]MDW8199529.1 tetratricopeptide repeat protein [Gemmataceae bacterium]
MWMVQQRSAPLERALQLAAAGQTAEAEQVVRQAALAAKAKYGSGSHPLTCAYGDMGRFHLYLGVYDRAAHEFRHAHKSPMPSDAPARQDRLLILFGWAEALTGLGRFHEADQLLQECVDFAKKLHGSSSGPAWAANAPRLVVWLKLGQITEAMQLAQECYDVLWSMGDAHITPIMAVRAEVFKALGRTENPFGDLMELPDELAAQAVQEAIAWSLYGHPVRIRAVLADLLALADKKFGDGHPATAAALAAIIRHEERLGERGDPHVRQKALRRWLWSSAVRRMPDLLANLEVELETDGFLHLVPHLTRPADIPEIEQLEAVLNQALDELYPPAAV